MKRLDITGMSERAAQDYVARECDQFGQVKRVEIFRNLDEPEKAFALVYMVDAEDLARIVEAFGGRRLFSSAMIPVGKEQPAAVQRQRTGARGRFSDR